MNGRPQARSPLIVLGWLLFASLVAAPALAHPYHTTIAEMDWNAARSTLEVALRLLPDDLDRAVAAWTGKPPQTTPTPDEATIAATLTRWLEDRFIVRTAAGDAAPIAWVGRDIGVDHAWLYFEIHLADGLVGCSLEQRIMLDLEPRQVNTVLLRAEGERTTLTFSRESPSRELRFDQ